MSRALLLQIRHVAEPAPRGVARIAIADAVAAVVRLAHRQMEGDLVVQVAFEPAGGGGERGAASGNMELRRLHHTRHRGRQRASGTTCSASSSRRRAVVSR